MKVLVTGSSGLVGSALLPALRAAGHRPLRALRRDPFPLKSAVRWDPREGFADPAALAGVEAAVHLAGVNLGDGRWTDARKVALRESRVEGTASVAKALAALVPKPSVLVCASAVGYYGDRAEPADESAPAGEGFLSDVCREWEAAADPARQAGIRVVHLRSGIVLSAEGGALEPMLLPFRLGLGGRVGSGRQPVPWISLADEVGVILHALTHDDLSGPVNAVAPETSTNRDLMRALARALRRPAIFPLPAAAVRLLFGEMGETLLLGGAPVVPRKLQESGYAFRHPTLAGAMRAALGQEE